MKTGKLAMLLRAARGQDSVSKACWVKGPIARLTMATMDALWLESSLETQSEGVRAV